MTLLEIIRDKIARRMYEFSRHAVDQSIQRNISVQEMEQAILAHSKLIEAYPEDKYGPSYLISGITEAERPIHIQCACVDKSMMKIVTLYEPDPKRWVDATFRKRKG